MHLPSRMIDTHSSRILADQKRAGSAQLMSEHMDDTPLALESSITIAEYVESRFFPGHIKQKTDAGRRHYEAILKHILSPERVSGIFAEISKWQKPRLSRSPDWPYLDDIRLCDIGSEHVQRLIDSASARGYSPQTIKHIKNVVGAIIVHAQNGGVFQGENPASKIRLEPITHRTSRNITMQQAKAIVALLDGADREIALLSLTTGLSAFEICKLQWKHVNLGGAPVACEGEIIPPRSILVHREPALPDSSISTLRRTKTVAIPDALFRRLHQTKRVERHSRPEAFVLGIRGEVSPSGDGISRARLVRVGRELGIPWLSWQVLKRGHQALLTELRDQLSCQLVSSVR